MLSLEKTDIIKTDGNADGNAPCGDCGRGGYGCGGVVYAKGGGKMKLQYFGTAAYEGIPSLFCNCETCKRAMALGGKNLRTRAQALLNDEILFDFNADTVAHFQTYKFDWNKIKYCLITHSHSDHFYPEDVEMLVNPAYTHNVSPLAFYAGKSAYDKLAEMFSSAAADASRATATLVKAGDLWRIGENTALALAADHDPASSPLIYAVQDKEGKRMLYAHDTGVFSDEVIGQMKRMGGFHLVSLDCTGALNPVAWQHGHMSLLSDIAMKDRLLREGLADENTKFIVTHFTHNAFAIHDDLCRAAEKHGFIVGYDGLTVEV